MWFSQPCPIPGEPTNNAAATRTYNVEISSGPADYTRKNPWRAPGSATVFGSGCGMAGGGPVREMNGGTAKEFGLLQNMDGLDLPSISNATVWRRGTTEEVSWANNANHGGGYSYRLCKYDPNTAHGSITEGCFQRTPLDFVGDVSWIDYSADNRSTVTRTEIPRVTVSKGTTPKGSQWARNPIPSCRYNGTRMGWDVCKNQDAAGCCASTAPLPAHPRINASWWRAQDCIAGCAGNGLPSSCPTGESQFPEPIPGLSSLWTSWLWCDTPGNRSFPAAGAVQLPGHTGVGSGDSPHMGCSDKNEMMKVNIVDKVAIPGHIEPGHYLVSWRWDSEQTNQIWQNCGDVTITD